MTTNTTTPATDRTGQASVESVFFPSGENWRRWAELSVSLGGGAWLSRPEIHRAGERIVDGTRELTAAQMTLAGEWLRAPFWATGYGSPRELQAGYLRLFAAQRALTRAYLDAAVVVQRGILGATDRASDQDHRPGDVTAASEQVAPAAPPLANAAVAAARTSGETAAHPTNGAVTPAATAANTAATATTPAPRLIKGNINARGEKIYHLPGQANYERVEAEQVFETEEEARQAGFRPSQR